MTEPVQIALIVSVAPSFLGAAALIVAIKTQGAVKEVHLSLNSRLDQLLIAAKLAGHAQGVIDERKRRDA